MQRRGKQIISYLYIKYQNTLKFIQHQVYDDHPSAVTVCPKAKKKPSK